MLDLMIRKELRTKFRNHQYEVTDNGQLLLPGSNLLIGGVFANRVKHGGIWTPWDVSGNIMVDEGLTYILACGFDIGGQAKLSTWFIAPFEGNYTPVSTDTAANIATNATESTAYTEANRIAWVEAGVTALAITNSASTADFSINATKTMYGAFLISNSTKSGSTGTLAAASKFAASRAVVNLDTLSITYTLTAADA